jgi:sec-independent protein translocase protein TatB
VFGLDATEMLVLVIVGIVVVGPKKLPQMMRTAGQWVGKLRRMSSSLRSQSGIDEILRIEGLEKEMRELRALTRINVMDSLVNAAEKPLRSPRQLGARGGGGGAAEPADAAVEPQAAPATDGAVAKATARGAIAAKPIPGSVDAAKAAASGASAGVAPAVAAPKPPGAPPPGAIARTKPRAPVTMVALPGEAPLVEREWPVMGCDAYDALPDDLEEQEAAAEAEALAAREAAEAEVAAEAAAAASNGEAAPPPADAAALTSATDAPTPMATDTPTDSPKEASAPSADPRPTAGAT